MTQTHEEGWKRVDRNHGEYVSASRYWQLEGGTQADLEPTIAAITKCTKMGWPFCAWNDLTDRFDFLRLHKEFDEEFSKSWAIFKKSNIDPKKTADADTSTGGEAIVDSKRKNLIEKSAKKPKIAGDSLKQRGWSDRTPGQILQEAEKMKAKHVDITCRSLQLKKNIADDASWAWAVAATEPFDGAYGAVMQAALLEFPTLLHTHDLAGVKKTMSPKQAKAVKKKKHSLRRSNVRTKTCSKEKQLKGSCSAVDRQLNGICSALDRQSGKKIRKSKAKLNEETMTGRTGRQ